MKKLSRAAAVVLALATFLSACGGSGNAASTAATSAAKSAESKAEVSSDAREVNVKIGYELNPGEPVDLGVTEWKRVLEENPDVNFNVEQFPSSQLGSKNDLIDQMTAGDAVITIADGTFFADRGMDDFGILFAPYLFETWDDADALYNSDWFEEQSKKLEEKLGLKILSKNWIYGARYTMTSKPVQKPEDFKGLKIRVNANAVQVETYKSLGAAPTPMALGEVYTSLQQGTIDGLENPIPTLYNAKYQEVCKYLLMDGMIKNVSLWICGMDFYNSLTPEEQDALIAAANQGGEVNNQEVTKAETDCLNKMKEAGVQVYELTDEERALFREKTDTVYTNPEVTDKWSEGLYDTVKAAMGKQ